MFVHARSELSSSPNGFRLLDQIRQVWNAADSFTAAVDDEPASPLTLEAGRLAFADLQSSYDQLRNVFGQLPGGAPRAGRNMMNMGRVVAVIGPLLRSDGEPPVDDRPRAVGLAPLARTQASEALAEVQVLEKRINDSTSPAASRERLHEGFQRLSRLLQGLVRIAGGPASPQDLIASIRPIRKQVQRMDLELQRSGRDDLTRSEEWRNIQRRIDGVANRVQLPREIVPQRVTAPRPDASLVVQVDRTIADLERFLSQPSPADDTLEHRLFLSDTRRVRHRLDLLLQGLLGEDSMADLSRASRNLERAIKQLDDSTRRAPESQVSSIEPMIKELSETLLKVREHLSGGL